MTAINPELEEIEAAAAAANDGGSEPYPPERAAYWALFIFALSLVVNFLDRGILNLLVAPIKRDLHLSDFRFSMLMGPAFVIFYVLLGLPIARLVDSRSRRGIIGIGLTCWSVMTAACGLAQGFWSFFVARVGVGVGEACTGPATYSMLSDLFPREKLPRAIAFMQLGTTAGMGLALLLGAAVIQALTNVPDMHVAPVGVVHNWQLVFFIVGIPGLIVALLMRTVVEPKRRGLIAGAAQPKGLPLKDVIGFLVTHRATYAPIFLALGVSVLSTFGTQAWAPTFYQRTFGWPPQQSAVFLGIGTIVVTPIGLFLGTLLVEWYNRRRFDDANLRVVRWSTLCALPFPILGPLMPSPWLAIGFYLTGLMIASIGTSAQNAALQTITPNQMRGQVTALYLFVFNAVGFGLGPVVIASLTDGFFHDEAKIGQAMSLTALCLSPIAVICYWLVLKSYGRMVGLAKTWR